MLSHRSKDLAGADGESGALRMPRRSSRSACRSVVRGMCEYPVRRSMPEKHARMSFEVTEATAILARTPPLLDAWLRGLPKGWQAANEGGDSWSPFDVLGHLIHGEK